MNHLTHLYVVYLWQIKKHNLIIQLMRLTEEQIEQIIEALEKTKTVLWVRKKDRVANKFVFIDGYFTDVWNDNKELTKDEFISGLKKTSKPIGSGYEFELVTETRIKI